MSFGDIFKSGFLVNIPSFSITDTVIALLFAIALGLLITVFFIRRQRMNPYILVITCKDQTAEEKAFQKLQTYVEQCIVKTKSVSRTGTEITLEVRLKTADTGFIYELYAVEGVRTAMLMSYNGEYMS